jgi:predicted  nucleic acid-binding Zn-ribbon protein
LSLTKQEVTDLQLREGVREKTIIKLETQLEDVTKERNKLNEKIIEMEEEHARVVLGLRETLFEREK